MTVSPVAANWNDQLNEKFQHLQDDWTSYQQSLPRQRRRCHRHHHYSSSASTTATTNLTNIASARTASLTPDHLLEFLDQSPKKLLSSLQQWQPPLSPSSEPSQDKEEEVASATEVMSLDGEVEFSSVSSSSELIQVAPYSSCSSNAASFGGDYLSSCSSPAASLTEDREAEVTQKIEVALGGRMRKMKIAGMGVFGAISLMAIGLGVISYVRELNLEEYDYDPPT